MSVPNPDDELARLRAEVVALRAQVAKLTRQRDHYRADLEHALETSFPLPPTEEEIRNAVDNSHELRALIADLEARGAGNEPGR